MYANLTPVKHSSNQCRFISKVDLPKNPDDKLASEKRGESFQSFGNQLPTSLGVKQRVGNRVTVSYDSITIPEPIIKTRYVSSEIKPKDLCEQLRQFKDLADDLCDYQIMDIGGFIEERLCLERAVESPNPTNEIDIEDFCELMHEVFIKLKTLIGLPPVLINWNKALLGTVDMYLLVKVASGIYEYDYRYPDRDVYLEFAEIKANFIKDFESSIGTRVFQRMNPKMLDKLDEESKKHIFLGEREDTKKIYRLYSDLSSDFVEMLYNTYLYSGDLKQFYRIGYAFRMYAYSNAINNALKNFNTRRYKHEIRIIDQLFENIEGIPYDMIFVRGTGTKYLRDLFTDEYRKVPLLDLLSEEKCISSIKGKRYRREGYTSMTLDMETAKHFAANNAKSERGYALVERIHCKRGEKIIPVDKIASQFGSEFGQCEFLLQRKFTLTVDNITLSKRFINRRNVILITMDVSATKSNELYNSLFV